MDLMNAKRFVESDKVQSLMCHCSISLVNSIATRVFDSLVARSTGLSIPTRVSFEETLQK